MAYRTDQLHPSGKNMITFNPMRAMNSTAPFGIPCGRCTGCRLDKARQWATRCLHESRSHLDNCFLTLTYDDDHLPETNSVDVREWQLFMKRLRKKVEPKIRFFACGEYGDKNYRAHYHALIFGYDFPDKVEWKTTPRGHKVYRSPTLEELWPYGFSTVGSVTHESAGYVARYTMKKIGGDKAADHYLRPHPLTGKLYQVKPEFAVMSRRPGIGHHFATTYKTDFYPSDFITVDGVKTPIPRYYLKQLSEEEQRDIKRARTAKAIPYKPERTNARRFAKMTVRDARIAPLKREL